MELDLLVETYKALADKTRLKILALLKMNELCVCELVEVLQITQPAISQHLRKLKQAKLVRERRSGQWVFYSLDGAACPGFSETLRELPDMSEQIAALQASSVWVCCR